MPMELGIHLGARLLGTARHRRKRALILEAKPHRYDAALSDISRAIDEDGLGGGRFSRELVRHADARTSSAVRRERPQQWRTAVVRISGES